MIYLEQNKKALAKFQESFPDIRLAFDTQATEAINYLRLLGYVCSVCGKNEITIPILRFFNFQADAKCYDCQKFNLKTYDQGNKKRSD